MTKFGFTRPRRKHAGAALIEMAVCLPLFVLLVAGLVYLGGMFLRQQQLVKNARYHAWSSSRGTKQVKLSGADWMTFRVENAGLDSPALVRNDCRVESVYNAGELMMTGGQFFPERMLRHRHVVVLQKAQPGAPVQ